MAKILLVEDDKSLREIYGVRLLAEGYDIVSAGDGEEALAMAIKERPQLIVSDVMMPKISGFDMLDILRSTTETKDIKVIMMTALSSEDQRKRGEELGADRYLVKSQVGIEDVVRTVHDVLGDAPVAPAGNAFAPAAPSAVPRPAASTVPARPEPAAAPTSISVTAPASDQTAVPVTPQTPAPAEPPQPSAFAAPPQPVTPPEPQSSFSSTPNPSAPSGLPQPTAPFSTARPAGLADRIIQPLERPVDDGQPLGDLMDKELGTKPVQDSVPTPPVPPTPPAPNEDHGIAFEETPRSESQS